MWSSATMSREHVVNDLQNEQTTQNREIKIWTLAFKNHQVAIVTGASSGMDWR